MGTHQKGSLSGTSSNPAKPVPSHYDKASVEKPVDLKSKEPNAEGGDGDEHEDDRSAPADAIEDPTNQHSKPGSSKAVLDPRVAHDRDVIREQNAKILEWRSDVMDAKTRLVSLHKKAHVWNRLAESVPSGPLSAMFRAKMRATQSKETEVKSALSTYDNEIATAEAEITKATKDAAAIHTKRENTKSEPKKEQEAHPTYASVSEATDRERAARKELDKRKQIERAKLVAVKVAKDKNEIQALQSKAAAVEADESQAEAQLEKMKKAEDVWRSFTASTSGATQQQFQLKLKSAQRNEAEAEAAVEGYKQNVRQIEHEIQKDTTKMNAEGKTLTSDHDDD